jgi:hypothetical protein
MVFGAGDDPRVPQQIDLLMEDADGTEAYEVGLIEVGATPDPASMRDQVGVGDGEFAVILIGKDGTEQFRADRVLPPAELWARIDATPLRRAEMRRRQT